jgi:hypothetical protein
MFNVSAHIFAHSYIQKDDLIERDSGPAIQLPEQSLTLAIFLDGVASSDAGSIGVLHWVHITSDTLIRQDTFLQ